MGSLGLLLSCAALGWLVWEYRRAEALRKQREAVEKVRANQQRFLDELVMPPCAFPENTRRLAAETEVEDCEQGVFIKSQDIQVVAEVVSHSPAFGARAR